MTTTNETYTAVQTAFDPRAGRQVEISRRAGLTSAQAKAAAKTAIVTRDADGQRMMLAGRKLVPAPAVSLDVAVAAMERAKSVEMPRGPISQDEADQMAEDLGDYSHYRTR